MVDEGEGKQEREGVSMDKIVWSERERGVYGWLWGDIIWRNEAEERLKSLIDTESITI